MSGGAKGAVYGSLLSIPLWVAIAAACQRDWWLMSNCIAATLFIAYCWWAPVGDDDEPRREELSQPYLDRFEVLRREAARKEAA